VHWSPSASCYKIRERGFLHFWEAEDECWWLLQVRCGVDAVALALPLSISALFSQLVEIETGVDQGVRFVESQFASSRHFIASI
jgi:hypothetical protein